MGFFDKFNKRKKLVDIEKNTIIEDYYYYTLTDITVKRVAFYSFEDIRILEDKIIEKFSEVDLKFILDGYLEGFCLLSVTERDTHWKWHALVDVNFVKECCVQKSVSVIFRDGLNFELIRHVDIDTNYLDILFDLKVKFLSMFIIFEEEAANAFQFGLIDVFTNMMHQLSQAEEKEDADEIILEVNKYMDDVYNTMVDMDALKQFSFRDAVYAISKIKEDKDKKEEERRIELKRKKAEKDSFIFQVHVRQELLKDFNKPIGV